MTRTQKIYLDTIELNEVTDWSVVLPKMAETGVSWCESGETPSGEKTTICGNCKSFNPGLCDCVNDEINSKN